MSRRDRIPQATLVQAANEYQKLSSLLVNHLAHNRRTDAGALIPKLRERLTEINEMLTIRTEGRP